jgi:hypothetical protein
LLNAIIQGRDPDTIGRRNFDIGRMVEHPYGEEYR